MAWETGDWSDPAVASTLAGYAASGALVQSDQTAVAVGLSWEVSDWSEPAQASTPGDVRVGSGAAVQEPHVASGAGQAKHWEVSDWSEPAVASTGAETRVGSGAAVQADHAASGAGVAAPPLFVGSGAAQQPAHTASGSGYSEAWEVGEWSAPAGATTPSGLYTGSGACVQGDHVAAALGLVQIVGQAAVSVAPDVAAGAGLVRILIHGEGRLDQPDHVGFGVGHVDNTYVGVGAAHQQNHHARGVEFLAPTVITSLDWRSYDRFR